MCRGGIRGRCGLSGDLVFVFMGHAMKKLLWFNVIVSLFFLLLWAGLFIWWRFMASRPFLKPVPQDAIDGVKEIVDLEQLRKVSQLLIEKDLMLVTQMNEILERALTAIGGVAQLSSLFFVIASIWLYRLLRSQQASGKASRAGAA